MTRLSRRKRSSYLGRSSSGTRETASSGCFPRLVAMPDLYPQRRGEDHKEEESPTLEPRIGECPTQEGLRPPTGGTNQGGYKTTQRAVAKYFHELQQRLMTYGMVYDTRGVHGLSTRAPHMAFG